MTSPTLDPHTADPTVRSVPLAETPWTEIIPGLFVGCHDYWANGRKHAAVAGREFDLVVSLFSRAGHGPALGVQRVTAIIPDGYLTGDDLDLVAEAVQTVIAAHVAGHRCLIRCQAGLNRSALVVALVLVNYGWAPADAIRAIRDARSRWALCNESFVRLILQPDVVLGGCA